MSKTVDVDLRLRAKNLSKSALKDITDDVERLSQSQAEQAKSADLAARSMRDLVTEQQRAGALARELSNRRGLLQRYVDERKAIKQISEDIQNLTALRRRAAASSDQQVDGRGLKELDKDIRAAERRLTSFTAKADKTKARLDAVGVSTANVGASMAKITSNLGKATQAYDAAATNVAGYGAAVQRSNEIQAEATRRTNEEAAARARLAAQNKEGVARVGNRNAELTALRQDIEARSAQSRATDVAAEAQRRLRAEEEKTAQATRLNSQAVREAVQTLEARRQRQAALEDAFGRQLTMQEREQRAQAESNSRRQRLIALIQSERGQRLLALEAQRQGANADQASANAKRRLANETNRAAKEQAFFADTGRKSLSVYQRIRGQVLGLASAYIGVYQAINTVSEAIAAVNRDQSLMIGLRVANDGSIEKAAEDYKFLREEADRLGLVFDDVAPRYANMAVAAKDVGLAQKETRDLFSDIATSVAAGNLSVADSEGVFRAIVQIMGKARVQAEELRGQLGDRLPAAVSQFAKANNIAIEDLDKMLKKGELGVEELVKFAEGYAKQFAPVMDEVSTRLVASMNRARNAYNDWLRDLLNNSNQTKLKQAFERISEFFSSREGEDFAKSLGDAFAVLIDLLIWLADNVDLVAKAFKIFMAVQITKFALDTASAMGGLATQIVSVGRASKTATGQVTGMAKAAGALRLALVGIAALVAGVTLALDAQSSALKNTISDLDDYRELLARVGRQQGKARAQSSKQAAENVSDIQAEIQDTEARMIKLQKYLDDRNSGIVGKTIASFGATFDTDGQRELGLGPLTTDEEVEKRINALNSQRVNLLQTLNEEREISLELLAEEARLAEEEAKKPEPEDEDETDPEAEAKARAKAEAAARRAEALARRREAAEDSASRKILALQDEIEQAKIESAARSDDQIEANFRAAVERIGLDIDKKRLEIQAIERQSEAAGVDNSSRVNQMRELLVQLEKANLARADEERIAALVELREQKISDIIEERNDKIALQNTLMETGQQGALTTQTKVRELQDEYNERLRAAIAEFQSFLATLDPEGELYKRLGLDKVLRDMELLNAETVKLSQAQMFFNKWGESIAQAGGNMLEAFANAYAETGKLSDAFQAARDSFLQFAADFLMQIAKMIIQAIILQAIKNALNNSSGGYGAAVSAALTAAGHTGGVVGSSNNIGANPRRMVSPLVFAGAQKFHQGGLPGLKTNEVAAVLKKGEEVLTEDDPRHVSNGGGAAGAAAPPISIINAFDREQVAAEVMKAGVMGTALLNWVGDNAGKVNQRLGRA